MPHDQDLNRHVGAKLYALRKSLGISQAALGKEIGVTGQQVQKYERGADRIGVDKLHQLARLFEVSVNVFFPAENATRQYDALPPASTRLIKMMNKIPQLHQQSLYTIVRELVRIIQKSDAEPGHE